MLDITNRTPTAGETILSVRDLETSFFTDEGVIESVRGVSLDVQAGKTLCVLGESGCGKSVMARSILGIVDRPGKVVGGSIEYSGMSGQPVDILKLHPTGAPIRAIRGGEIAMIFQEPMTSLSPVHTIGSQISSVIRLHQDVTKTEAKERAIDWLNRVGIPRPEERYGAYPFQLSGGMRQRAMIALALCCEPKILIADEPTTALDVTTQANILDLLRDLQQSMGMAMVFITHDLGVVAEIADDVVVMYLGQVVERGPVNDVFNDSLHPYTQMLMRAVPRLGQTRGQQLTSIKGMVPHPFARPLGCQFNPRCPHIISGTCEATPAVEYSLTDTRAVRCNYYDPAREDQTEAATGGVST